MYSQPWNYFFSTLCISYSIFCRKEHNFKHKWLGKQRQILVLKKQELEWYQNRCSEEKLKSEILKPKSKCDYWTRSIEWYVVVVLGLGLGYSQYDLGIAQLSYFFSFQASVAAGQAFSGTSTVFWDLIWNHTGNLITESAPQPPYEQTE